MLNSKYRIKDKNKKRRFQAYKKNISFKDKFLAWRKRISFEIKFGYNKGRNLAIFELKSMTFIAENFEKTKSGRQIGQPKKRSDNSLTKNSNFVSWLRT